MQLAAAASTGTLFGAVLAFVAALVARASAAAAVAARGAHSCVDVGAGVGVDAADGVTMFGLFLLLGTEYFGLDLELTEAQFADDSLNYFFGAQNPL